MKSAIKKTLKRFVPNARIYLIKTGYIFDLLVITVKGQLLKPVFRYMAMKFGFGTYFKDAPNDALLKRWAMCEWVEYGPWTRCRSLHTDNGWYRLRCHCLEWKNPPLITIVTPTFNTPKKHLYECIGSVQAQAYPFWEMCIVDDGSYDRRMISCLKKLTEQDSRFKLYLSPVNRGICHATNRALEMAAGEYIAFLDHDDRISPEALFQVAEVIRQHPSIDIIYSDRDMISPNNLRFMHLLKPDWAPETLFATNYTCHLTVYSHRLLKNVGGLDGDIEGSQDHDLILRADELNPSVYHIPRVFYHWRQHNESLALNHSAKNYAYGAAIRAIEKALKRRNLQGKVAEIPHLWRGNYRVELTRPEAETYTVHQFICRNTVTMYAEYVSKQISEKTNKAYIVILDGSFFYKDEDALQELVSWFQISEVGIVTGKIIDDRKCIVHAGLVHRPNGIPFSIYEGYPATTAGYMASTSIVRNVSSPHPGCFAIRKDLWDHLGGFKPQYAGPHAIMDLALRALKKGSRIVYTPFAQFVCKGNILKSEDWPLDDRASFVKTWSKWLNKGDPYYNPGLTTDHVDMGLNGARSEMDKLSDISVRPRI